METQQKSRVRMDEIGLFLRTIQSEYQPKTNQEMADLISHHFNVICLVEDINHYEELTTYHEQEIEEDYELMGKREQYCRQLGVQNPFY